MFLCVAAALNNRSTRFSRRSVSRTFTLSFTIERCAPQRPSAHRSPSLTHGLLRSASAARAAHLREAAARVVLRAPFARSVEGPARPARAAGGALDARQTRAPHPDVRAGETALAAHARAAAGAHAVTAAASAEAFGVDAAPAACEATVGRRAREVSLHIRCKEKRREGGREGGRETREKREVGQSEQKNGK